MRVSYFLKSAIQDPVLAAGYFKILSSMTNRRLKSKFFQSQATNNIYKCFDHRLVLNTSEQMQAMMAKEIYSPRVEYVLRKLLHQKKVFYDVGSHVGYFSALACQILPADGKAYAFEPNPDRLDSLKELEKSAAGKFKFFPLGLSDTETVLPFAKDTYNTGMSRVVSDASKVSPESIQNVQVQALDKIIQQNQLLGPEVMKVDVEGHELHFFKGAIQTLQTFRPTIICEVTRSSHRTYDFKDLARLINQIGYKIYPLDQLGRQEWSISDLENSLKIGNADIVLRI